MDDYSLAKCCSLCPQIARFVRILLALPANCSLCLQIARFTRKLLASPSDCLFHPLSSLVNVARLARKGI